MNTTHGNKPASPHTPAGVDTGAGAKANTDQKQRRNRATELARKHRYMAGVYHRLQDAVIEQPGIDEFPLFQALLIAAFKGATTQHHSAADIAEFYAGDSIHAASMYVGDVAPTSVPVHGQNADHDDHVGKGDCSAVITIHVLRDRITERVELNMGRRVSAERTWRPMGDSDAFWHASLPDWADRESELGIELVEFMDELPLADRIAKMLPAPPTAAAAAAVAETAKVVGHE